MVTPFYSLGNVETDITIYPKATVIDLSMDCKQLLALWGKKKQNKTMTNLENVLENRDITFLKGLYSQSYDFSSSPVWM